MPQVTRVSRMSIPMLLTPSSRGTGIIRRTHERTPLCQILSPCTPCSRSRTLRGTEDFVERQRFPGFEHALQGGDKGRPARTGEGNELLACLVSHGKSHQGFEGLDFEGHAVR